MAQAVCIHVCVLSPRLSELSITSAFIFDDPNRYEYGIIPHFYRSDAPMSCSDNLIHTPRWTASPNGRTPKSSKYNLTNCEIKASITPSRNWKGESSIN